ncbi:MarR family winged helix-turn-helix transcriptional regulator [Rhizobium tubonense]|uniref:MarR family transcriptional regulator n=1 Tax=Rhizobium tubonense TaxID=484088 RepID=A0A2W4CPG3_9HYPH|nr:MarR family winged helix-turn-helix transcriptional regulator [Rhizobium tubonense]PZM14509.1 MarR family transcriptional regulator [Rhizobium tubonense]
MQISAETGHIEETPYQVERQVGFLLRQANQRHVAIFSNIIGDKLTTTQWSALSKLQQNQPCSQNQLGRETAMDVATIKGVVDRLVKRGLVATVPDMSDARRVVLSLTQQGEEVVTENRQAARAATEETLSPLTSGERMIFLELLQKLC